MAKKIVGTFDRAKGDFLRFSHAHKVEQEKHRPYLSELALAFFTRQGLVKQENGDTVIAVGEGWKVMGRVGTRAARYIVPLKDPPDAAEG